MDTQPQPVNEKVPIKKKRHTWYWWLLGIVVVIVLAIAWTGICNIPVASAIMGANKPKDLGVKVSEEAYVSIQQKVPLVIEGAKVDYSSNSSEIFSGSVPVDTQNTSEEVTSWLNKMQGTNPAVTDVQVRMIEGGVEISGMVQQYVKAPLYAKVMINRTSEKSVSLDITSAKLGRFSVPVKYVQQFEDWVVKKVNSRMASIPGFSLTQLEYHDGYDIWKGTVPAQVRPAKNGYLDLVLE
ncbi:MAG: hypothetical protein Q8O51_01650 [bacterium]|nr:hypothetical protein [bacterium]